MITELSMKGSREKKIDTLTTEHGREREEKKTTDTLISKQGV